MIINENNKNLILKGKIKRGFNQTPEELREKLMKQNEKEINKKEETNIINDYYKLKKARNNLKRF